MASIINALEIEPNWLFQDEVQMQNEISLTLEEAEGIRKYRDLSKFGKEAVRDTLDREYRRDQLANANAQVIKI